MRKAEATLRKRRYRARLRRGLIVVDVEVSNEIIALLIDTRYPEIGESEDRGAIATAIAEMLDDVGRHLIEYARQLSILDIEYAARHCMPVRKAASLC